MSLVASIPSPSDGVLHIGPLAIHAYGLMIALGVVAAVWLAGRRMEAAGVGTRDDMSSIALWAVGAGVVGARLYYVVTDKSQPWKEPSRWLKIWEGGLGIPGGLLAGVLVSIWAILVLPLALVIAYGVFAGSRKHARVLLSVMAGILLVFSLVTVFAAACRRIDLRSLDVDDGVRRRVLDKLGRSGATMEQLRCVRECTPVTGAQRSQLFGEQLPAGLRLSAG